MLAVRVMLGHFSSITKGGVQVKRRKDGGK